MGDQSKQNMAGFILQTMAGNIKIIEPKDNFQKVSKDIIFNDCVDALTLGIYVKILTLGKKWELNIKGLASVLRLSDAKIKYSLNLLEKVGYIRRVHIQGDNGRFVGFDYYVGAVPFPEDERTDLVATHSSNHPKNQPLENPTDGKTNGRKNQLMENQGDINREYTANRNNTTNEDTKVYTSSRPARFDFYKALRELGVSQEVADAWMQVRKAKKAVNTEIAFNAIAKEIAKAGKPADTCIRLAVEKSWCGFKAEWLENDAARSTRSTCSAPGMERNTRTRSTGTAAAMENMLALGREMFGPQFNNPTYDEQ